MKQSQQIKSFMKSFGFLSIFIFLFAFNINAKSTAEIDASIESAIERFTDEIKGGQTYLDGARGVLVIPKMIKAGLVLGVEYGEGALVVDNIKVQYYRAFSGSLGLQLGIGSKDLIILFYDDEAMDEFIYSSGWQVGVDGSVAILDMGAGGSLDSTEAKDPIVGFVFGHKGLIAGLSLEGTKFTKIWPDAETESEDASIESFNESALD
jgi:lipid-binding SYLF domain-containing protein